MLFEILVEGQSDKTALSILLPKIIGEYKQPHEWFVHKHRGLGRLPDNPLAKPNRKDQSLLHNLPSKLRAYGARKREDLVVVVLMDLDDNEDCLALKKRLSDLLNACHPPPKTLFRIAIEELEAWFLADPLAIQKGFPDAKLEALSDYIQDSQCGTWELLGEVLQAELEKVPKRSPINLERKRTWAAKISPHLNVESNPSPSFQAFRDGLRRYISFEGSL